MDIRIEPEILRLIRTVENDISKVVSEALHLWLKEKILICPITEGFCENLQGSCNNCPQPKQEGK